LARRNFSCFPGNGGHIIGIHLRALFVPIVMT
jgi:hypothetical protein